MDEPRVVEARTLYSLTCGVEIDVRASPEVLWLLLTDARGFPRWNSTVTGIDGEIREGEQIVIHAPGTGQTFKPRVSNVVSNERMTWTGGVVGLFRGVRTFVLTPRAASLTRFAMQERFSGLLFALLQRAMPDFGPIFATYAADLKHEAERPGA